MPVVVVIMQPGIRELTCMRSTMLQLATMVSAPLARNLQRSPGQKNRQQQHDHHLHDTRYHSHAAGIKPCAHQFVKSILEKPALEHMCPKDMGHEDLRFWIYDLRIES